MGFQKLLGNPFVHCNGTAQITIAGITYAKQIKGRLHLAVLAILSVKRHKYNVCHPTDGNDIGAKEAVRLVCSGCPDGRQIRHRVRNLCHLNAGLPCMIKDGADILLGILVSQKDIE